MKAKVWKLGDPNQPKFPDNYKVTQRWEGNCMNVSGNNNKFYHAEIQVAPDGRARILTMYGRVGNVQSTDYRYYTSENACMNEYESLIKKKRDRKNNPYIEVDLAITSVGSDGAKEIIKPTGINIETIAKTKSNLHPEIQRLVKNWFGDTADFIEMNLKCPLGQLTKKQIDKGYDILIEVKNRVNAKAKTSIMEYDNLTSKFYSLIPHILPRTICASDLRLDKLDKIIEKENVLDTFLDAKNVSNVLSKGASVDLQYKKLKADLQWLPHNDPVFKWIENLLHSTRAPNHRFLGKIKVFDIFKLKRNNESKFFNNSLERIAKEVDGKGTIPKFTNLNRIDISKEEKEAFKSANVWPLWHGTKPQNMVGIITRGLLIRPAGAVYTGSMFGDALYHAENSTKSMNYTGCKGSYWAKENKQNRSYLFLEDVIIGKSYITKTSKFFKEPPMGHHSVYAVPGVSLYNSENMTYASSGPEQQHRLKYIIEFQSNQ